MNSHTHKEFLKELHKLELRADNKHETMPLNAQISTVRNQIEKLFSFKQGHISWKGKPISEGETESHCESFPGIRIVP